MSAFPDEFPDTAVLKDLTPAQIEHLDLGLGLNFGAFDNGKTDAPKNINNPIHHNRNRVTTAHREWVARCVAPRARAP